MSATSVTLAPPVTRLPAVTVLRRAVASEWTRLWTVRSTWWALAASAGTMLLMGFGFGQDFNGPAPVWVPAEIAIAIAQFALYVLVMLPVTSDYATGAIRSSLQAVPRRGVLLTARMLVVVTVATVAGVLFAAGAGAMALPGLGGDAEIVAGDIARSLGRVAIVVATGAVLTVGLASLLRSSAGTLTSVFMLLLVLPQLLTGIGVSWLTAVGERLPGYAQMSLLETFGIDVAGGTAATVLAVWVVSAVAAGAWRLLRRDAA